MPEVSRSKPEAAIQGCPATPADLPPPGDPDRWSHLQELRRRRRLEPEPWLAAIEAGTTPLQSDLVAVLSDHLDGEGAARLLSCWLRQPRRDPDLPALFGSRRDPLWAACLRLALTDQADSETGAALLPLLGHQRDPADFPLLQTRLLEPGPLPLRMAALEGLCRGLSAWPIAPLRQALLIGVRDLQPRLAAAALDALARLPAARSSLLQLHAAGLDASIERRRQRRLQALPAAPLLLLAHGRAGGERPAELQELADELTQRRGAPVTLQILTGHGIPSLPEPRAVEPGLILVPLLLFPGRHVRCDLPQLAAALRQRRPLRRLPFLGAWSAWQQALAEETATIAAADTLAAGPAPGDSRPLLLHHPLDGLLAGRYLELLAARCAARLRAAGPGDLPATTAPILPLALAANRLTESLRQGGWDELMSRPLLARDRLRQVLQQQLLALP